MLELKPKVCAPQPFVHIFWFFGAVRSIGKNCGVSSHF